MISLHFIEFELDIFLIQITNIEVNCLKLQFRGLTGMDWTD